ncbi:putative procollagen-proline 4-dioxygenase [Helianthus anomalus]
MASKSRLLPRGPSRRSSSSTLIFSIMIICSFFVQILLALGILSILWVEVISWEPRAIVYHNFLVRVLYIYIIFLSLFTLCCIIIAFFIVFS